MTDEKVYTLAEVEKLIAAKNEEYLKVQGKLKAKGLSGEDRNDLVILSNDITRDLRRLRDGPLLRAKREKAVALTAEEDRKREAQAKKAEEAKRADAIKRGKAREDSRKAAAAKEQADKAMGEKRLKLEAALAEVDNGLSASGVKPEEHEKLEKEYARLAKELEDLPEAYPVRMRHGYSKADGWEGSYRGRIRVVNGEALARSEREERLLEGRGYVRVESKPGDKALAKKLEPKAPKAPKKKADEKKK